MLGAEAQEFLLELEEEGISLGLERVERFLKALGNPERGFAAAHIAGTNGKGSTAAMLEGILRSAGYKTGLYTSPHLLRINERVKVNGKEIGDRALEGLVLELKQVKERKGLRLTHFEFLTALAFAHFARQGVQVAVVEVGMGGRLDATNVLLPAVSVITNVEKEHEKFLGETTRKIAAEKAGVIKEGKAVVTAEWKKPVLEVLRKKCRETGARLFVVQEPYAGKVGMHGGFQKWNAAVAAEAAHLLGESGFSISGRAIGKGLREARLQGRFQAFQRSPPVVVDCAHNPSGAFALARAFRERFPGKKALLVFGASRGKKVGAMARALAPVSSMVFATEARYRALPAGKILSLFKGQGAGGKEALPVERAVKRALESAGNGEVVLACGSCFVAGEALEALRKGKKGFSLNHKG